MARRTSPYKYLACLTLLAFSLVSGFPSPVPAADWGEGVPNLGPAETLSNANGHYDHWKAIARIVVTQGQSCTATFIDTLPSPSDTTSPAYLLTAGHCAHPTLSPVEVVENEPGAGTATFNYFHDTAANQPSFTIKNIIWATLRGQDISIIELNASAHQLIERGIAPLKIALQSPAPNTDILIVGAPLMKADDKGYLQRSACTQSPARGVLEGLWTWLQETRNGCTGVRTGVSGSPVLGRYTNEILGVIGTTTQDSGSSVCARNAPCEVADGAPVKFPDINYATPATGLSECFVLGRFDRKSAACPMGNYAKFSVGRETPLYSLVRLDQPQWAWQQGFSLDSAFYRYKQTRTVAECANESGYSNAVASQPINTITQSLDSAGLHFLCVIGVARPHDALHQKDLLNALVFYRWLIDRSSSTPPIYVRTDNEEFHVIRVYESIPDLDGQAYRYKFGPPAATDCNDDTGYQAVHPSLRLISVPKQQDPSRLCLKGANFGGFPSPISTIALP